MEKLKKKKSGVLFLVLAVLFALTAAGLSATMLRAVAKTQDVVVVVRDVNAFERLEAEDIAIVSMPAAAMPADVVVNPTEAVGKFIKTGMLKESVLRKNHLARDGSSSLSARLTFSEGEEMRAFALPYESIVTFGGKIAAEDRIDLIGAVSLDGRGGEPAAKIIAQNIKVLDVVTGEGEQAIIIAVSPELAEELVFLLESGKVYASLNPYETDIEAARTKGVYNTDSFINNHLR